MQQTQSVVKDHCKLPLTTRDVPGFSYLACVHINPSDSVLFRGTFITKKTRKRGSMEHHQDPWSGDISYLVCLHLALSPPHSPSSSFPISFSPLFFPTYLLLHKIPTIVIGTWSRGAEAQTAHKPCQEGL